MRMTAYKSERQKGTENKGLREWYIACCSHFTPRWCPVETPLADRLSIKYVSFVFEWFRRVNSKYLLGSGNQKKKKVFIEKTASMFDTGVVEGVSKLFHRSLVQSVLPQRSEF